MTDVHPGRQDVAQLVSVVYSSVATVPFSEMDLAGLLMVSRMHNEARGLTGMLLHRDGQFMQVLEGPQDTVRAALAVIAADPRHTGVWLHDEESIEERRFGSWAMGYRELAADDAAAPPVWYGSPEASDRGEGRVSATRAGELLAWFRDH